MTRSFLFLIWDTAVDLGAAGSSDVKVSSQKAVKAYVDGLTGSNESDPKIGTLTTGKWCRESGNKVVCDQNEAKNTNGSHFIVEGTGDVGISGDLTVSGGIKTTWNVITSNTTAVANKKYLLDTSSGAFTLTLPLTPSAGDTIKIVDFAGTFENFNLTISRNGEKIMGLDEDMTVDMNNASFGLVYTNAANGWRIN